MKISFPTYLNQVWNFFADDTGKIQVLAGEISENAPTSYDTAICTLNECPESEERAKLIANAPDMFRVLCNIGGEVNNGTASLSRFHNGRYRQHSSQHNTTKDSTGRNGVAILLRLRVKPVLMSPRVN